MLQLAQASDPIRTARTQGHVNKSQLGAGAPGGRRHKTTGNLANTDFFARFVVSSTGP
jgi:hypothetical protein